jgi:hypothetical protein
MMNTSRCLPPLVATPWLRSRATKTARESERPILVDGEGRLVATVPVARLFIASAHSLRDQASQTLIVAGRQETGICYRAVR